MKTKNLIRWWECEWIGLFLYSCYGVILILVKLILKM